MAGGPIISTVARPAVSAVIHFGGPRMRVLSSAVCLILASAAWGVDAPNVVSKVVFGSCANQDQPLPIFDAMTAEKPDLMVLLGDNIYNDLDRSRKVTTTVIKEKYATLAAIPAWQKLRGICPLIATWDDHDYGVNDSGVEWEYKTESQQFFHDFLGTPSDSPLRTQEGVYSSHFYGPEGKRLQVILLDTRYFRSPLKFGPPARMAPYGLIRKPYIANSDPDATMLGDTQWAWLAEELKKPADVRLIGSSVQLLAVDHPFEKWANLPRERQKLFDVIKQSGANGLVVLSGDRHLGELSLNTDEIGYPLYDLTSSGLNQAHKAWRAVESNRYRVSAMPFGDNYGVVTIDWTAEPTIALQLKDDRGQTVLRQPVPLSLLKTSPVLAVTDDPAKPPAKLPEGVLTPAEASKKVGEEVKVQFTVKSGRAVNDGKRILLNSDEDFKAKANFTVVLNNKAMTGKYEKAKYDTFKDKVICASGKVSEYKGAPQIQIDEEKLLEIVEKE